MLTTKDVSHSHRFPWTNNQKATVALSAALTAAFAFVMFAASGKPSWLILLAFVPVAGWWSFRANQSRKERSEVRLTVKNGLLSCVSPMGDSAHFPIALARINRVSRAEYQGRPAVIISSLNENGIEERQRIPFRIFTPGNPVGPIIIDAAEMNHVDVTYSLFQVIMGLKAS
jgi:hypothetical protein